MIRSILPKDCADSHHSTSYPHGLNEDEVLSDTTQYIKLTDPKIPLNLHGYVHRDLSDGVCDVTVSCVPVRSGEDESLNRCDSKCSRE